MKCNLVKLQSKLAEATKTAIPRPKETHAPMYKVTHKKMLIVTLFVITKTVSLPNVHPIG